MVRISAWLVTLCVLSGCTLAGADAVSGEHASESAWPARTWRLSHMQYARAVQGFVGVLPDTSQFEEELDNGVFPNMSGSGLVRTSLARDYYDAASIISSELPPENMAALIGGRALLPVEKRAFLSAAISSAFRRPARSEELDSYGEIFELGADEATDGTGPFRAVIRALLTSPFFLYRTELGERPEPKAFRITDYELASLLSFSLLNASPPARLLAAAESGELSQPARLAAEVRALLALPEAAAQLRQFMAQWLEIDRFGDIEKDPLLFPDFAAQRPLMWAEAESLLAEHGSLSGSLRGLMSAPIQTSPELSAYYGSQPSAAGAIGVRAGVLGLGAVIAAHSRPYTSSPTLRGLFVRERLLCQEVHLPPSGTPSIFDSLFRTLPRTTRELYEQHAQNPSCAGCHALLDSIGFNFEDIDAAGRFRTLENDVPIDTRGELANTDVSGPTLDRSELSERLSRSTQLQECVARQAVRFYFGLVEKQGSAEAIEAARQALASGTFGDLLATLMTGASVRERVRP